MGSILLALTAASAAAAACELHVWPAGGTGATSSSVLSHLGIAGAIADYERHKDGNLTDQLALIEGLPPAIQARLLAQAGLPDLLGMPGAAITFEGRPIEPRTVRKNKTRASRSTAPCYAELIVTLNAYRRSTLHGRQLISSITFKDFRHGAPKVRSGREGAPVPHFPPTGAAEAKQAQRELGEAFTSNVRTFAAKAGKN